VLCLAFVGAGMGSTLLSVLAGVGVWKKISQLGGRARLEVPTQMICSCNIKSNMQVF
jgi:hypothetical protein